eukprot:457444_1
MAQVKLSEDLLVLKEGLASCGMLQGISKWRCFACGSGDGGNLDCSSCNDAIKLARDLKGKREGFDKKWEKAAMECRRGTEAAWQAEEEQATRLAALSMEIRRLEKELERELERRKDARRERNRLKGLMKDLEDLKLAGRSQMNYAFRIGLAGDAAYKGEMDDVVRKLEGLGLKVHGGTEEEPEEEEEKAVENVVHGGTDADNDCLDNDCLDLPRGSGGTDAVKECLSKPHRGGDSIEKGGGNGNLSGFSFGRNRGRGRGNDLGGGCGRSRRGSRRQRSCLDFNRHGHCNWKEDCLFVHRCMHCRRWKPSAAAHPCSECAIFKAAGGVLMPDGTIKYLIKNLDKKGNGNDNDFGGGGRGPPGFGKGGGKGGMNSIVWQ